MTDSEDVAKIAERSCASFIQFYPTVASRGTMAPYQSREHWHRYPGPYGPMPRVTTIARHHHPSTTSCHCQDRSHGCHPVFVFAFMPRRFFHMLYRKMMAGHFPQGAFLLYLHFFLSSPFLFLFHFVNVTVLEPGESERGNQLGPQLSPRLSARDFHCHASKIKSQGRRHPRSCPTMHLALESPVLRGSSSNSNTGHDRTQTPRGLELKNGKLIKHGQHTAQRSEQQSTRCRASGCRSLQECKHPGQTA